MPDNPLKKKVGPLPAWGWIAAIALGAFIYYRSKSSSAATTSASDYPASLDPNAVDPATGLTYGQEQSSASAGIDPNTGLPYSYEYGTGSLTPTTGATTDTGTTGTPTPVDLTGGFLDELAGFAQVAKALGYVPAAGVTPQPAPGTSNPTPPTRSPGKGKEWAYVNGKWKAIPKSDTGTKGPKQTKPPVQEKGSHRSDGGAGVAPPKSKGAKTVSTNRAPAHPNENTAAQAAAHTLPKPASTRITIKPLTKTPARPKPGNVRR